MWFDRLVPVVLLNRDDGASEGVLGDSLEFSLLPALLPGVVASMHRERYSALPICMPYCDIRKFCNHIGSLASTCSLDILLHSKAEPNSLGLF